MNSGDLLRALACGALLLAAVPSARAEGTFDIPAGARFNQDKLANPTEWVVVPHPNLHIGYMASAAFKATM